MLPDSYGLTKRGCSFGFSPSRLILFNNQTKTPGVNSRRFFLTILPHRGLLLSEGLMHFLQPFRQLRHVHVPVLVFSEWG